MDPARPRASAVAVAGGRIVASATPTRPTCPPREVVDLGARRCCPGSTTRTTTWSAFGLSLTEVDLRRPDGASTSFTPRVAARAAATPAGEWIIGAGYDQNKLGAPPAPRRAGPGGAGPPGLAQAHLRPHVRGEQPGARRPRHRPTGRRRRRRRPGRHRRLGPARPACCEERAQELVGNLTLPVPARRAADAMAAPGERYLAEGLTSVTEAGHRRRLGRPVPGRARRLLSRPRAGPAARPRRADGRQRRACTRWPRTRTTASRSASTWGCAPASATTGCGSGR